MAFFEKANKMGFAHKKFKHWLVSASCDRKRCMQGDARNIYDMNPFQFYTSLRTKYNARRMHFQFTHQDGQNMGTHFYLKLDVLDMIGLI